MDFNKPVVAQKIYLSPAHTIERGLGGEKVAHNAEFACRSVATIIKARRDRVYSPEQ